MSIYLFMWLQDGCNQHRLMTMIKIEYAERIQSILYEIWWNVRHQPIAHTFCVFDFSPTLTWSTTFYRILALKSKISIKHFKYHTCHVRSFWCWVFLWVFVCEAKKMYRKNTHAFNQIKPKVYSVKMVSKIATFFPKKWKCSSAKAITRTECAKVGDFIGAFRKRKNCISTTATMKWLVFQRNVEIEN